MSYRDLDSGIYPTARSFSKSIDSNQKFILANHTSQKTGYEARQNPKETYICEKITSHLPFSYTKLQTSTISPHQPSSYYKGASISKTPLPSVSRCCILPGTAERKPGKVVGTANEVSPARAKLRLANLTITRSGKSGGRAKCTRLIAPLNGADESSYRGSFYLCALPHFFYFIWVESC